jgi:hypothetical protein
MSESLERLARNQSLYREANERIETKAADNEVVEFLCECTNTDCADTIELKLSEYERVRSNATWFVIQARSPPAPDRTGCFARRRVRGRREANRRGVPGGYGSPLRRGTRRLSAKKL